MANGLTFDKLVYVERLQASGFSEPQAKGAAEALDGALKDTVATKHDIELLRYEMQQMEYRITTRLGVMIVAGISILAAIRFFG